MKSLNIWQCRKTGECCKRFINTGPRLTEADQENIIKFIDNEEITNHLQQVGTSKKDLIKTIQDRRLLPLQNRNTCIFLKNDQCLIHEVKPAVCDTYPLAITHKEDKTHIMVDLDCPRGAQLVEDMKKGNIPEWVGAKGEITIEGRYFFEDAHREHFGEDS